MSKEPACEFEYKFSAAKSSKIPRKETRSRVKFAHLRIIKNKTKCVRILYIPYKKCLKDKCYFTLEMCLKNKLVSMRKQNSFVS